MRTLNLDPNLKIYLAPDFIFQEKSYNKSYLKCINRIQVGDKILASDGSFVYVSKIIPNSDPSIKIFPSRSFDFNIGQDTQIWISEQGYKNYIKQIKESRDDTKIERQTKLMLVNINNFLNQDDFNTKDMDKCWKMFRESFNFYSTPEKLICPPYLYGVWLMRGTQTKISIICDEVKQKVIDLVKETKFKVEEKRERFIKLNKDFYSWLKDKCHVGTKKFISPNYLFGNFQTRIELLSGILDSAGNLDMSHTYDLTNTNEQLVDNIRLLAISLGFLVTKTEKEDRLKSHNRSDSYKRFRVFLSGDETELELVNPKKIGYKRVVERDWKLSGIKAKRNEENVAMIKIEIDEDKGIILENGLIL